MQMKTEVEYLIIGAGPAGLQLGYYLEQASRDYLILEAGDTPGTFFKKFPRHRRLISINKLWTGSDDPEFNLRSDWNSLLSENEEMQFTQYNSSFFPEADHFVRYLGDFADHFHLRIEYGVRVTRVTKADQFNLLDSDDNAYTCQHLIVATGVPQPYIPPIHGIELAEDYTTVSVASEDFINQKVLIIGKGNSSFETADNLIETAATIHIASPNSVMMAWKTHYVGHLRAVNNNILDTYQLKSQNAILDASIDKIERKNGKFIVSVSYTHADGEKQDIAYDRVITCTGFRFDDSIFDQTCRPTLTLNNRFPAQTSEWKSTNVKDLYFAGTLMQTRDHKKTTSAFIHGFRYNVRALHRICEKKYHGQQWPSQSLSPTPTALMGTVIERVNKTSALWQQFGFLCDLILLEGQGNEARYFEEMPVDYVHDSEFGQHEHYYTVTLEYGPLHDEVDPFNISRITQTDVEQSHLSKYLHPVIRRFAGSRLICEHHIVENLDNEWNREVHTRPLMEFFRDELSRDDGAAARLPEMPESASDLSGQLGETM